MVIATALTGCSGSHREEPGLPPTPDAKTPISFVPTGGQASRQWIPLERVYTDFGVVAWKIMSDNSRQTVMSHSDGTPYQVAWDDVLKAWRYEFESTDGYEQYLKFWDFSAVSYGFSAVTPYIAASTLIDPATGAVTLPSVVGNAPAVGSPDWAVARQSVDNPTAASVADGVPLRFNRLMSGITVKVYLAKEGEVTVTSLKARIEDGASISDRAAYNDGSWAYNNYVSGICDFSELSTRVTATDKEHAVTFLNYLEIPQDVSDKRVKFTVTLSNGNAYVGTFPLEQGWEAAKQYIYYLKINVSENYIFMDVDITTYDWTHGGDIEPEDPVTNW